MVILAKKRWNNIFEWNTLKDRDLNKPLIKFDGGIFSVVTVGYKVCNLKPADEDDILTLIHQGYK